MGALRAEIPTTNAFEEFTAEHAVRLLRRTKIRIPERPAGDWVTENYPSIPGRFGSVRAGMIPATDQPTGRMILVFLSEHVSIKRFRAAYRACKDTGMAVHQRGDYEGSFVFDPCDESQAQVALKVIRARKRRTAPPMTPERIALLREARRQRKKPCQNGHLANPDARDRAEGHPRLLPGNLTPGI